MRINRRRLVLATAASLALAPARAQGIVKRVSILGAGERDTDDRVLKAFYDRMRELGWKEGGNITYDRTYPEDRISRLPDLAEKLVARKPDLIFALNSDAARAAAKATSAIPIVFGSAAEPIHAGLVASLARPGGNVTGIAVYFDSLTPKRIEMLREALPATKRIGVLFSPGSPSSVRQKEGYERISASLGIAVTSVGISDPRDLEKSMALLLATNPDAIVAAQSVVQFNLHKGIVDLADRAKVPVFGNRAQYVEQGALLSYGTALAEQFRRAADLVDKVLKGVSPATLPVEQPTKYELVLNARKARALGITLPQSVLLRADRVIE